MLDRSKVLKVVQQYRHDSVVDHQEIAYARAVWQELTDDPLFSYKCAAATTSLTIPIWLDSLTTVHRVQDIKHYTVVSVDGSQIYPDRHTGIHCSLINIGTVILTYANQSSAAFNSIPHLVGGDDIKERDLFYSPDLIHCMRDEHELSTGLACVRSMKNAVQPTVLLFDGSLIFWHLESKDNGLKEQFLPAYLTTLQHLYEERLLHASYISLPKSRDVSHCVRLAACSFNTNACDALKKLEFLNDVHCMNWTLQPHEYSTMFKYTGSVEEEYPAHLKPYYCYVHNGKEIARVEMPAWIAQDEHARAQVIAMIGDQCVKGNGYPIALAEAHEQAVVKGPDREFFYQLLAKVAVETKQRVTHSQKNLKKRSIGI